MFLKLENDVLVNNVAVNMDNVDKITFEGSRETETGKISFLKYTGASVEPVVLMEKSFTSYDDYIMYMVRYFNDKIAPIIEKL